MMFMMPQKKMVMHDRMSAMLTNRTEYACRPYNLPVWSDGRRRSGIACNVSERVLVV